MADRVANDLLRPVLKTSRKFYALVGVLGFIVLCGIATWGYQLYYGYGVTGYNWPV